MKTICLYFQVHQPFRLRRYRFFDINQNHYYYDDYLNELVTRRIAENCYLPTNALLMKLIKKHKDLFKVTFSISGLALDQFELYAPEVIDSFKKLAATGNVEFLSETYSHSLASLTSKEEFYKQIDDHKQKIEKLFNYKPQVFRNTELIYSDGIGADIEELGFKAMLTEGAKHIMGWKSPNFLYCHPTHPKLKLLFRNYVLSDDIAFRFSNQGWAEFPLTADKYVQWIKKTKDEIVNIFMDYETFGEHQKENSGIFSFLEAFPKIAIENGLSFMTPSQAIEKLQPVSGISVPSPISWADEERDTSAWLGNDLQSDAFNSLYKLKSKVNICNDPQINTDWRYLQASDHFYYMCTKFFTDGAVHSYFNPFESPYDAYINYMNILSDFGLKLDKALENKDVKTTTEKVTKKTKTTDDKSGTLKKESTSLKTKKK